MFWLNCACVPIIISLHPNFTINSIYITELRNSYSAVVIRETIISVRGIALYANDKICLVDDVEIQKYDRLASF